MTGKPSMYPLLFLLSCLMVFSSCSKSCRRNEEAAIRPITIDVAYAIEALDPRYTTSATASRVANLIYGTLFEIGEDALPKPLLAESLEAIDDHTFKIVLKKNLKFHDGSSVTADDVVFTYENLGDPDVASLQAEKFYYVDDIKAVDEHTVIFSLKGPHATFMIDLAAIGIVSKKTCLGRSQKCRHEHNGSGPFKVKSWDQAKETLHLVPFPDWCEGAAKSDLLIRVVRDENTRMLELLGKKVDLVDGDISPINAQTLAKEPFLRTEEMPGLGYTYLAINVRGPKAEDVKSSPLYRTRLALADKKVRKAMAQAIDFDQIIEKLLKNTADRSSGMLPKGHWAKDEALKPWPFDPKAAELELDEAGFKRQAPDNMRFKLTIATTPNRLRQSAALLFVDFLQKVGIDASIRVKEWSALYQDMKQGQFEMFTAIWTPVLDPDLYYFVHHSSNIPEGEKSGGNRHGYKNATADRLIELGRTTMDQSKRKAIYQEIERILLEDLPYIPLWHEHRIVVINSDRLGQLKPSITGSFSWLRNALTSSVTQKANP